MNDINEHVGKFHNKAALIVLGGPSALGWKELADKIKPDVVLGANGVNSMIPDLDYWMCIENMRRSASLARKGDSYGKAMMEMLNRTGPKVRLVFRKSVELLKNLDNVISVSKRPMFEPDAVPEDFSFRHYGAGYIKGSPMKNKDAIGELKLAVGTVGLQLLHHAGILGCKQVHTIGYDLQFREGQDHHAYKYPSYQPNVYFKPKNFTEHLGVNTMWFWIETAQFLLAIKPQMDKVGLEWVDHSDGLLSRMGMQ